MYGTYVFLFFEGQGKETVARDCKDFLEALLGEEVGVGRALERPWEDPALVKRTRSEPGPGEPGHDGPWSYSRSVFSFPTYEARFRGQDPEDEWFEEEGEGNGEGPAMAELCLSFEGMESTVAEEGEDESLYLFGEDMPPEWREAPLTLCFPPFALPASTEAERRESRPKARKMLQWLRRRDRRNEVEIHMSAGFFAPVYLEPRELTAARLLVMSSELQELEEAAEAPVSLDLDLAMEDPEKAFVEPRDQPSWPARIWQRRIS